MDKAVTADQSVNKISTVARTRILREAPPPSPSPHPAPPPSTSIHHSGDSMASYAAFMAASYILCHIPVRHKIASCVIVSDKCRSDLFDALCTLLPDTKIYIVVPADAALDSMRQPSSRIIPSLGEVPDGNASTVIFITDSLASIVDILEDGMIRYISQNGVALVVSNASRLDGTDNTASCRAEVQHSERGDFAFQARSAGAPEMADVAWKKVMLLHTSGYIDSLFRSACINEMPDVSALYIR